MKNRFHATLFGAVLSTLVLSGFSSGKERAGLDWWAFQPVDHTFAGDSAEAIDHYIAQGLAQLPGLTAAPPADRPTLIRRLYHDLLGLTPTVEEIQAFERSGSVDAYERLVDRLLARPEFGERWARHWLDVVRFAETNGYERDAVKPNIWKYRDWVIKAFNEDLSFDRFVLEQVAGDELPDRTEQSVIATGMLRAGTWNDEPNDPHEYKYERLEDLVDVVTTSFLAVTVKCARCHDHKFDPIPQRDYYRVAAAFWPGAIEPRVGKWMGGPSEEELGLKNVFGWTDVRKAPPLHLLVNGDPHRKGTEVAPGFLSLVPVLDRPFSPPKKEARTSERRLQLARALVDPRNPLTSRVLMNRVWQHLFGRGIVGTPNNFGFKADPPTHPELLDWLASDFMKGGWRVKRMIRQIVRSKTYRQASVHPHEEKLMQLDPANRLWWRVNRRRKDAEALRDTLLQVSGELNPKQGGPSFYPVMAPEVLEGFSRKASAWTPSPKNERRRRSVYMMSKRHLLLPLMTAFDFPNSEKSCGRRNVTTVAPQALAMFNNDFVHERSQSLALQAARQKSVATQVAWLWRSVYGRNPMAPEIKNALHHYWVQRRLFEGEGTQEEELVIKIPKEGLIFWLRADRGIMAEKGGVARWDSEVGRDVALQRNVKRRPQLVASALNRHPVVRFAGNGQFLAIPGRMLAKQTCSLIAVASDRARHQQHREIISNWDGAAGNSTRSLFLGLTGAGTVRFSDDFSSEHPIANPDHPFILMSTSGGRGVELRHNGSLIGKRATALRRRGFNTQWVVGQQGNIQGEYWKGDMAEILVYDRELSERELRGIGALLEKRYAIPLSWGENRETILSAEERALASVAHVLLNSNEFLYVD